MFILQESCKILQNNRPKSSFILEDSQKRWSNVLRSNKTTFLLIECVHGEIRLLTDYSYVEF